MFVFLLFLYFIVSLIYIFKLEKKIVKLESELNGKGL